MSVTNAKKAIILIYLGKAEIVERYAEQVHTVKTSIALPSVVRLLRYIAVPHKRIILSRKNIIKRDLHRCQYCGKRDGPVTVDHVIPKYQGGADSWENLVCACIRCNTKKGNQTPAEAGMKLEKKPRKPNHIFMIQHFFGVVDERWRPYLYLN
ncbi:HNH endonuclease [candidate division KSB1 bacterium]|nr:HNH endonuclease [candidate division KSB1 bacterium]